MTTAAARTTAARDRRIVIVSSPVPLQCAWAAIGRRGSAVSTQNGLGQGLLCWPAGRKGFCVLPELGGKGARKPVREWPADCCSSGRSTSRTFPDETSRRRPAYGGSAKLFQLPRAYTRA